MNLITRILCATTLVALPVSLVAQEKGGKPAAEHKQDPKADPKKPEGFSVVTVGDAMKCVATADVDTMKKSSQDEFTKAMDSWKAAKKAAEDKKEKFEKPQPKETVINVVKGGFKTMDEGTAFITAEKAKKDEKAKGEPHGKEEPKKK